MSQFKSIEELVRAVTQSLPQDLQNLREDLNQHLQAALGQGLQKMNLVSREEFDTQTRVLERTRERLEALEARLALLERLAGHVAATPAAPDDAAAS